MIEPTLLKHGFDVLVPTNAIHLYYDLDDTLASWRRSVRKRGRIYIQSGNINNPHAPDGTWIIDETVEHIHRAAMDIVRDHQDFSEYRDLLEDIEYMKAHDALRAKYFLPVRHVDHYQDAFERTGFKIRSRVVRTFDALVTDWYDFLSVYHEGVLGWVGGAEKIVGHAASDDEVIQRKRLMSMAMDKIFDGNNRFRASWTYFQCEKTL